MIEFANRISHLRAEGAYTVLPRAQALEAQDREIIHLEIGQSNFETHLHIVVADVRMIDTSQTHYNPPSGIPALRQAPAEEASQQLGSMPFRASIARFHRAHFTYSPISKPQG